MSSEIIKRTGGAGYEVFATLPDGVEVQRMTHLGDVLVVAAKDGRVFTVTAAGDVQEVVPDTDAVVMVEPLLIYGQLRAHRDR